MNSYPPPPLPRPRRGVYAAPWIGPTDELVLIAITSDCRLAVEPVIVPHGASRVDAADALYAKLDALDPVGARRAQLRLVKS